MRIKSPVFVGRREELAMLHGRARAASEGQPSIVVIGGEAGVGKSRLLAEFASLAQARGMRVLSGVAADFGEGGLPFGPVVEALRPVREIQRDLLANLAFAQGVPERRIHPELRASLPQQRMFDLLLSLLERLAGEQPSVLTLEDLHWADASTREFLAFLARNLGNLRLLVVGTYRSDDLRRDHPLRRYLAELERGGRIERFELRRFGEAELRQQIEAISGEAVGQAVLQRLFQRSQGNPFFTEEVLAAERQGVELPPDLRELLLARLEGLSAVSRHVLAAAAVAGRADDEFLAVVTGLPHAEVAASLRQAIDRFVLEPSGGSSALGHAFRHALLREAIYDDLLSGERVRLHRRVAEAMSAASEGSGDPTFDAQLLAQLAHHWQRAGQPEQAFIAAWRAAEAAERARAYPEASRQFEGVLELWAQLPQPEELLAEELRRSGRAAPADRAYVIERAAAASDTAGELHHAIALYEAAAAEVDPTADPDRAVAIQLGLVSSAHGASDGDATERALNRATSLLHEDSPADLRAAVLLNQAGLRVIAGQPHKAIEVVMRAMAAAEEAGDAALLASAHVDAGGALSFMGRLDEGLAHYAKASALARAGGWPELAAMADKWRGVILDAAARFAEAVDALDASQAVMRERGGVRELRHTDAIIGQALHRSGRWAEAEQALDRSLAPPAAEWGRVVAAYLYVGLGRWPDAERELTMAHESVRVSSSSASYGPYYAAQAELRIWRGDPAGALAAVLEGLPLVESANDLRWMGELTMLGARAAADLPADGGPKAALLLERLEVHAGSLLEVGTIFAGEGRAAIALAHAERARAHAADTPDLWLAAARAWQALSEPYPSAYARYRLAQSLLTAGTRAKAREALAESRQAAGTLRAMPLLNAIDDLAQRARLDVGLDERPQADTLAQYRLTAREREVLALVVGGRTDQQIAEALFISPKTASVHVSNIKAKLGVEHRIEAAAVGLRLELSEDG
ncbi:MAG TPA: AAA family ATPase [Candidatus Limnocylindria bacterium]|nr:AAA family ATPase [Candidatus Limnocylindria bacterium]